MKMQANKNMPERMYPIKAVCKDCGAEFEISVREQLFAKEDKGFVLPKRCPNCRTSRKDRTEHIVCIECGEVFDFTASEQEFYKKNGFKQPRRCRNCRKARKDNPNGQNISEENQ